MSLNRDVLLRVSALHGAHRKSTLRERLLAVATMSLNRDVLLRVSALHGAYRKSTLRERLLAVATMMRQYGDRRCHSDDYEDDGHRVPAATTRRAAPCLGEKRLRVRHEASIASTMFHVKIHRGERPRRRAGDSRRAALDLAAVPRRLNR
jgi:hypothetical protein